jgi:hypothetical protein
MRCVGFDHVIFDVACTRATRARAQGNRFIVRFDEKLTAFVELERQILTVTFYLESIDG